MTQETMRAVVEELRRRGIEVTLEYPGYITLERGTCHANFGDANETFQGDAYDSEQDYLPIQTVESSIPSDTTDVQAVADFIAYYAHVLEENMKSREEDPGPQGEI